MSEKKISSWMDLAQQIDEWARTPSIYRGVRSAKYELIPKIGREDSRKIGPYSRDLELELFSQFVNQSRLLVEKEPSSDLEWLIVAQHHSLPTRLLDWTFSPLIAAYFAVETAGTQGDAAIYVCPVPKHMHQTLRDPFNTSDTLTILPQHITRRVTAQRGVFTIHPRPDEPYKPRGLKKVVIEQKFTNQLRGLLTNLGVRRSTLFPGLDGICEDLCWELKWRWLTLGEQHKSGFRYEEEKP